MVFGICSNFVMSVYDLPSDALWPPSEKSYKANLTFLVIASALLFKLFRCQKPSQKARKVVEMRLAYLCEGQRLLLESVRKKDQDVAQAASTPKDWEEGLPETARVMGYLWDDANEQPTTQLGLRPDENHVAVKRLFNRALRSELMKAQVFTLKARELEQQGVIGSGCRRENSQSGSKKACEEWLTFHDSNLE